MLVTPPVVNDVPQILGRMPSFGRGSIQDRLFGHFKQNARGRTVILYIENGVKLSTLVDWPEQVVSTEGDPFTEAGLAGINYAPGYPFDGLGTTAGWLEVTQRIIDQGNEGIYWVIQGGKTVEVDETLYINIFQPLGFTRVVKLNTWDDLAASTWDELASSTWGGGGVLILTGDTANFNGGTLGRWQSAVAQVSAEVATHPLTGSSCLKLTSDPGATSSHSAAWLTGLEGDLLTGTGGYHAMPITPSAEYEFRGSFYLPDGSPLGIILALYTFDDAGAMVAVELAEGTSDAGAVVELTGTREAGATETHAAMVTITSGTLPDGASSYYDNFYLGAPT